MERIDYTELIKFTNENVNIPYKVKMLENYKYRWEISICKDNTNEYFPWLYTILIQDEFKRSKSLCNFELNTNNICEIVNIDSDSGGLGSIMFKIMIQMTNEIEKKRNIKIGMICGELSNKHKQSGDWIKSIPFYCMKAYEYSYPIEFTFGCEKVQFKKKDTSHDEKYKDALSFAYKYSEVGNNGGFCFYRN